MTDITTCPTCGSQQKYHRLIITKRNNHTHSAVAIMCDDPWHEPLAYESVLPKRPISFTVYGNQAAPMGESWAHKDEALARAKELTENDWATIVWVEQHEVIWAWNR